MGTYGDLKTSVVTLLNRDDLTDVVNASLAETILRLSRDFSWSSPVTGYVTLVIGQGIYPTAIESSTLPPPNTAPMDLVRIDNIRLLYSGVWQWIYETEYNNILHSDVNQPSVQSLPTSWAPRDAIFRLFPVPDQPYIVELTGNAKIPVPATDDDSNWWTTQAAALVKFATAAHIYLTRIHDSNLYEQCARAAEDHRISIVRETQEKSLNSQFKSHW